MGLLRVLVEHIDSFIPYLDPIDEQIKIFIGPTYEKHSVTVIALFFACLYVWFIFTMADWWDGKRLCRKRTRDAEAKRKQRDKRVHDCLSTSPAFQQPIKDGVSLMEEYTTGERYCKDTMLYCIHRTSKIGNKELVAVTEEFYDEALAASEFIDSKRTHGTLKVSSSTPMPLLGVPISIKDCFAQQGADSTIGVSCRCFKPSKVDGLQVKLIRAAGGIPFVRSNVPQLLMMPESENRIWGVTCNPWDVSRTPGGSSGGEGALIASQCSVMGLGSDIGGSIRIPAHYCGICGFKPTPNRVTHNGSAIGRYKNRNGQAMIVPTAGPMARSVRDMNVMMEVLTGPKASLEDPLVPPLVWDSNMVKCGPKNKTQAKKLRIGMMVSDGWCEPVPAVKRAVHEAAEVLRKAGHEVVEFKNPISTAKMVQTYFRLQSADGNWYSYMRALEGEDLHESYKMLRVYTDIPNVVRPFISFMLETFGGEYRKSALMQVGKNGGLSTREYWEAISDMKEFVRAYVDCFRENEYDALLMPTLPIAAPHHGMASDLIACLSYTFLANILHWPAGTVPVTLVREDETKYDVDEIPGFERDSIAVLMSKTTRTSAGMPIGVQIMTPMWRDELCLHLLSVIEAGVQFDKTPPKYAPKSKHD